MTWTRVSFAAGIILATASVTVANDSIGHLSAGGIVLGRSDDIEMRAEDLYVSTKEIRVRYRFFNKANRDLATLVAFPLPDVTAPSDAASFSIPVEDEVNFLAFKTQVDGAPVAMQLEQRVLALGIDRTDLLKSLGVPLAPYLETTTTVVRNLHADRQMELLGLGALRSEEYDIGQGMKQHLYPNWTLRTTYFWNQVFPANKEVLVEHQYKPSVGATAGTSIGASYAETSTIESYRRRYCIDREFIAAAGRSHKALERKGNGATLMERRLEYVLVTGANWAGPIKDFRLVVDKGDSGNLVSVCGKMKKISQTQFEFRQAEYWPDRNLEVLILEPSQ